MENKVFVVTVTYGNRFHLLKQVIESSFREGVCKVIVVDNNSDKESRDQLIKYEKSNPKIKVIYLPENTGSAGGYKRGLEEAYNETDCEFIWLLDDDNVPKKDALIELFNVWGNIQDKKKYSNTAMLSFREKKEYTSLQAILKNKPTLVLGPPYSFNGFSITSFLGKTYRFIRRIINKNYDSILAKKRIELLRKNNKIHGKVAVAPYGGLLIHKLLLDKIGYPKEKLFTYADDHEWSYRITASGGNIFFCLNSIVDDIELSWHIKDKNLSTFNAMLESGNTTQVFYSLRNRIYLEQLLGYDKSFIYNLNKVTFLIILKLFTLMLNKRERFNLILKAIEDGKIME